MPLTEAGKPCCNTVMAPLLCRLLLLALPLALAPAPALAIGVGPIVIDSELNEPFDARIELLDSADYPPDAIVVEQAKPATYQRLGIERVFALVYLAFKVDDPGPGQADNRGNNQGNGAGNKIIRITSREPIREPSFDLLLEVAAGSGRILKKYAVVLSTGAVEAAPRRAAASPARAPADTSAGSVPEAPAIAPAAVPRATSPATSPTVSPATAPSPGSGGQYGPVQAGETLWSIASRLRPGPELTVHQTMLALYRSNPDAFENGRVDGLKRGQMLVVPGRDLIADIDADAAFSEMQQRLAAP